MNTINFIEKHLFVDYPINPIKFYDWEKEIVNKTIGSTKIKKIWLLTNRKAGTTTFCKILHWFRPESNKTYIICDNLHLSNYIKGKPFYLDNIKERRYGVDCFEAISKRKIIKLIDDNNEIKNYKVSFSRIIDNTLYETEYEREFSYHFMYDFIHFDEQLYNVLESSNYSFFTICLPYEEYDNAKQWIEADRNRDDTIILIEPYGVSINDCHTENAIELFKQYQTEHLKND